MSIERDQNSTIPNMQVVCSRAANQFGWICKSVWPQSIRVKLYPIKINCEEISPLVSLDETITNEKTETLIVKVGIFPGFTAACLLISHTIKCHTIATLCAHMQG